MSDLIQHHHLELNPAPPPPHLTLPSQSWCFRFFVSCPFFAPRIFEFPTVPQGGQNRWPSQPSTTKHRQCCSGFLFVFDTFYCEHEVCPYFPLSRVTHETESFMSVCVCFCCCCAFPRFFSATKLPTFPRFPRQVCTKSFSVIRWVYVFCCCFCLFAFTSELLFTFIPRSTASFTVKMSGRAQSYRGERGVVRGQLVRGDQHLHGGGRVPPGKRRRQLELASEDLRHDGSGARYYGGGMLKRTYSAHKNLDISIFLGPIFAPTCYGPRK